MNPLQSVYLIARRDFHERVRSRTFRLATLLLVVLAIGGVIAADVGHSLFGGTATNTVGVVNPPPGLDTAIAHAGDAFDLRIKTRVFSSDEAADTALNAGEVDAVLAGTAQLRFKTTRDTKLASAVGQAAAAVRARQQLQNAGLSDAQIASLLSPQPLQVTFTDPGGEQSANAGAAFVTAIVLFGALMTYNQWILSGVVEEKSTRIVEVLLSVVRPWELLTGKLMGVLAVAVTQMIIVGVAFLLALAAIGGVSLPQVSPGGLTVALAWFVLGLGFYSVAFAAVGATVSRQEDASAAAAPLTMILMAAYFVSLFLVTANASGLAAQVLTFVPPASPMIVPVRYSLGAISGIGLAASIIEMVFAIAAVSWLGGRLYTGAVLHTGPRLSLGDTWRTIRGRHTAGA
jgi:ABC-2 type transport system permease protein